MRYVCVRRVWARIWTTAIVIELIYSAWWRWTCKARHNIFLSLLCYALNGILSVLIFAFLGICGVCCTQWISGIILKLNAAIEAAVWEWWSTRIVEYTPHSSLYGPGDLWARLCRWKLSENLWVELSWKLLCQKLNLISGFKVPWSESITG